MPDSSHPESSGPATERMTLRAVTAGPPAARTCGSPDTRSEELRPRPRPGPATMWATTVSPITADNSPEPLTVTRARAAPAVIWPSADHQVPRRPSCVRGELDSWTASS